MATRQILAERVLDYGQQHGRALTLQAVGGVDAARRVQAGEAFDVVVLAAEAIDKLISSGAALAGSRVDLATSAMALAVKGGAPLPDVSSETTLKQAVLAARSLAFSSGPSGTHLLALFERWGISQQIQARTVQAPPGVPVASLITSGQAELGFQQFSELQGLPGITVLHPLPGAANFVTTFAGAVCSVSARPHEAAQWLVFLASPEAAASIRRHGMQPVKEPKNEPEIEPGAQP